MTTLKKSVKKKVNAKLLNKFARSTAKKMNVLVTHNNAQEELKVFVPSRIQHVIGGALVGLVKQFALLQKRSAKDIPMFAVPQEKS